MTKSSYEAVVIGASAGAVDALSKLLPELPAGYALPVLVVVHVPADKNSVMAELLQFKSKLKVKEAEDKEPIRPGALYLAPPDYHLLVEKDKYLSLSSEEPVLYSRPSIDVLFETAADAYGPGLIGVILTGANFDGARGLKLVVDAGGKALVQHPETAFASAMPEAALRACPGAETLSLAEIAAFLKEAQS